jgi:hypothetical protein
LAGRNELSRHLYRARATKLPITVQEVLYTDDPNVVAILVGFVDGTSGGCLIPIDMLSVDNIRISAAAVAAVWEMLGLSGVPKEKPDEVIDLNG